MWGVWGCVGRCVGVCEEVADICTHAYTTKHLHTATSTRGFHARSAPTFWRHAWPGIRAAFWGQKMAPPSAQQFLGLTVDPNIGSAMFGALSGPIFGSPFPKFGGPPFPKVCGPVDPPTPPIPPGPLVSPPTPRNTFWHHFWVSVSQICGPPLSQVCGPVDPPPP